MSKQKKERIPLKKVKNFGPVCCAEFESLGLQYLDQIEILGFENTCRQWVEYFPERLNANAFLGVACALDGVVWTQAHSEHRAMAHNLVKVLRQEHSLPPVRSKRIQRVR